jgi:uncharacterized repeat protein (TIGR01451 family)
MLDLGRVDGVKTNSMKYFLRPMRAISKAAPTTTITATRADSSSPGKRRNYAFIGQIGLTLAVAVLSPQIARADCPIGGGTTDPNISPYISAEVFGSSTTALTKVDDLDNPWRTAAGLPQTGTIVPWFNTTSTPASFTTNGVTTSVQLIDLNPVDSCTGTPATGSPSLATTVALQANAPRPASLNNAASQPFWNENTGNNASRNAVLFTFARPVSSFGAWFGDLETRSTIANGTPAILRLLDTAGNRIGKDISIDPTDISNGGAFTPLDQNTCGGINGCGNNSTRWVGFVDNSSIPRVSKVLVIVGGDNAGENGNLQHLSFIGADILPAISGTVFEDINYGGGAGRSLAGASGMGRGGVTVELYDATGTLKQTTTTSTAAATLGQYSFNVMAGNYTVRVVNNTVSSSRTGGCSVPVNIGTCQQVPVQTFRTNASSGNAVADPNRVGGEIPSEVDAPVNSGTQTLVELNGLANREVKSIGAVKVSTSNVTGIDFGFNFDTIVNPNNSGQGSLNQFITNSNALANAGLDQVPNPTPVSGAAIDPAPGQETTIFMIPVNLLNSNGVADIKITSLLPQIIGADANNTVIDGRTQTANIGNTNNVTLGIGGTVGVDALPLSKLNGPEIQITGLNSLTAGVDIQANNTTVTGISIFGFGFGTVPNQSDLTIGTNSNKPSGTVITENAIGTAANAFVDPGAGIRSGAYGIFSYSDTGTFIKNLDGFHGRGGIELTNGAPGILIEGNEVRGNAILDSRAEGTNITSGGGVIVRGNLFTEHDGPGIDTSGSSGNNTYVNNTVTRNGLNFTGQADPQTPGLRIQGSGNIIDRNIIANNNGAGILARDTVSTLTITKNSIYGNGTIGSTPSGQIGIDLIATGENGDRGTGTYVTLNDGKTTAGANQLLDYPIFISSTLRGTDLILKGYARPGAKIELFIADPDPSGFGEGKTYLTTLLEGSGADTDTATGSYSGVVNGIDRGSDSNANRFAFTIPLASLPGVASGTNLTGTTTISNATSEFSNITTLTASANILLVKRIVTINGLTTNLNDNTPLNNVVDDPATTSDNNPNWPSNYLLGAYNAGKVKPGDEIEYAIYYLNQGENPANSVKVCDLLAPNLTFNPNGYASGKGFKFQLGSSPTNLLTSANDPTIDRAQYINGSATLTSIGCNSPTNTTTASGAVVVNLTSASSTDTSSPNLLTIPGASSSVPISNNSYGSIKFTVKVK